MIALMRSSGRGNLRTGPLRQFVKDTFPETLFSEHPVQPPPGCAVWSAQYRSGCNGAGGVDVKMKIGFVTDSTSDIPANLAEQYGIEIVPALVNINGKSYVDGVDISREEFYTRLPGLKPLPTTSSPSVGSFQERYEKLLQGRSRLHHLHPSSERVERHFQCRPAGGAGIWSAHQGVGQRTSQPGSWLPGYSGGRSSGTRSHSG